MSVQPVTGVPLSICRLMPSPRAALRYPNQIATHKQGMRDKRPPGSFEVAIDAVKRGTSSVVKAFTSYESHEDFFRETACLSQRNFYEIISDGDPCSMYFDIDHYCPSQFNEDGTLTDDKLAQTIATIRAEAIAHWPALAADPSPLDHVMVATASRMAGGVYKHLYNLIWPHVGFRNNCGALHIFARDLSSLDTLQAKNAKMHPMSLIDTSVRTSE